jgi:hypothetical protein
MVGPDRVGDGDRSPGVAGTEPDADHEHVAFRVNVAGHTSLQE